MSLRTRAMRSVEFFSRFASWTTTIPNWYIPLCPPSSLFFPSSFRLPRNSRHFIRIVRISLGPVQPWANNLNCSINCYPSILNSIVDDTFSSNNRVERISPISNWVTPVIRVIPTMRRTFSLRCVSFVFSFGTLNNCERSSRIILPRRQPSPGNV